MCLKGALGNKLKTAVIPQNMEEIFVIPRWETKQFSADYHSTNNSKPPKCDLGNCVMTVTI